MKSKRYKKDFTNKINHNIDISTEPQVRLSPKQRNYLARHNKRDKSIHRDIIHLMAYNYITSTIM